MRRIFLMAALAVAGGTAFAQSGQVSGSMEHSQATAKSPDAQATMTLKAVLTKGLDVRKARAGDPVVARTTEELRGKGDLGIPKNAKLLGHVTQAKVRGRGQSTSTLGIAFDRAQMKDGREIPLQALIQAMAPPEDDTGIENNTGAGSAAPAASHGAIGMKGLQLDDPSTNVAAGSVIHSSSDNVRLESGTRLLLSVTIQ